MDGSSKKSRKKQNRKNKLQQQKNSVRHHDDDDGTDRKNTIGPVKDLDLYSQIFPNGSESEQEDSYDINEAQSRSASNAIAIGKGFSALEKNRKAELISGAGKRHSPEETDSLVNSSKKRKDGSNGNQSNKGDLHGLHDSDSGTEKRTEAGNYVLRRSQSSSDDDDEDIHQQGFEYDNESGNDEEDVGPDVDEDDIEPEKDEEESEDSDDSDDNEEFQGRRTVLRKQLKDLSFEELETLKQKMGLKEYNEAMFGTGSKTKGTASVSKPRKRKFERTNKNRPREMSSKIRVPKLREIVKVPKKVRKDPRFDDSYGQFDEKFWNSEYEFLRDIQKKEAEELKKNLRSVDDSDQKKQIKRFIQKVTDKEKAIAAKEKQAQRMKQEKEMNKKLLQEGKKPFYVKHSTRKLMDLVDKYDELKASGRLEKYLKKKRKKNAIRDQKSLKPIK